MTIIDEVYEQYKRILIEILDRMDEIERYWVNIENNRFNDVDVGNASLISSTYQNLRFNRLEEAKQKLNQLLSLDINPEAIPDMQRFYAGVEQRIQDFMPIFQACNSFMSSPRDFRRRNGIVNPTCGRIAVRRYR